MLWRRILLFISLAINIMLVYRLVWGAQGYVAYRDLKAECDAIETRLLVLEDRNVALSREIRLLQVDTKYAEKMIRQRLNFVKNNEILYIFPAITEGVKGAEPDE